MTSSLFLFHFRCSKDQDGKYNAVLSTETEIFDFSQQSLQQTPSEAQHITLTYDDGNVTVTGEDQRRVAEMAVSIQYGTSAAHYQGHMRPYVTELPKCIFL